MFRTSSLPYDGATDADGHINEPAGPDEKSVRYMLGANVARVYGLS